MQFGKGRYNDGDEVIEGEWRNGKKVDDYEVKQSRIRIEE